LKHKKAGRCPAFLCCLLLALRLAVRGGGHPRHFFKETGKVMDAFEFHFLGDLGKRLIGFQHFFSGDGRLFFVDELHH